MAGRSESREEYLEAIFKLTQQPEGATVGRVADDLGLAAPSVSQMVARLATEGLVERDQASHVLLTKEGRREALRLVRRHRLSERFLTDYLDLPWDKVHDEACKFEHVLSDEVEERLAAHLGNPQTCPHGRAIPTPDGELPEEHARPLAELRPDRRARSRSSPTSSPTCCATCRRSACCRKPRSPSKTSPRSADRCWCA